MKKLLFAVCALAAISLLAPDAGYAQWENRIGIYTTATAGDDHVGTTPVGVPMNIYFVASSPKFEDGSPVPFVDAFEFRVLLDGPAGSSFRLAETMPPGTINVGNNADHYNSEYVAGFPTPITVTGGYASLMSWNMMFLSAGPWYFRLGLTNIPSVAGLIALNYTDESGATLIGCLPSSGDFDLPVFAVGDDVVAIENSTFGGVKALFR